MTERAPYLAYYEDVATRLAPLLIHGSPDQPLSDDREPLPYEPYASDGIEADHAADEEWAGPLRFGGVA